nr:restriction endonuclease [uncultured Flavobacterium sp.]
MECKNYNSNVSVAKVRDFFGVLSDIGNTNGIMVSKVGFQKGAKEFAEFYGINLRELRKPNDIDWKGRIKSIHIDLNMITTNVIDRKFNLDEEWIKKNIKFKDEKEFVFKLSGMADEIWIYDENGKEIINLYEIENKLPQNWKSEKNVVHDEKFDNGFFKTEKYGLIKVNSIEYLYDIREGKSKPVIIDGTEDAKAILKDAQSGEIKFFNKDGTIK